MKPRWQLLAGLGHIQLDSYHLGSLGSVEGKKPVQLRQIVHGMNLFAIIFNKITGPGKVYLQTMPIIKTAKAIEPYITFPTNTDGGKGINIRLGE